MPSATTATQRNGNDIATMTAVQQLLRQQCNNYYDSNARLTRLRYRSGGAITITSTTAMR
eukprot:3011457-Pyramimonas_sp.AAC.1